MDTSSQDCLPYGGTVAIGTWGVVKMWMLHVAKVG